MNGEDRIDVDSQPLVEEAGGTEILPEGTKQQLSEIHNHDHHGNHSHHTQHERDEEPKRKQRFEVKKWTAVAFWSWDIVVETCAICRNHLMEPCIECQPNSINNSADNCIAAWGVCNHAFHMHCIQRWLKLRAVCPLDNKDWTYQKFGS